VERVALRLYHREAAWHPDFAANAITRVTRESVLSASPRADGGKGTAVSVETPRVNENAHPRVRRLKSPRAS
jgi:hypothetical protein